MTDSPVQSRNQSRWMRFGTYALILIIGMFIGTALNPAKPAPELPHPTVATSTLPAPSRILPASGPVSAPAGVIVIDNPKSFGDEFDRNKVVAAKKYKDKTVRIVAELTNVNGDSLSFYEITTDKFSLTQISCLLADESQAEKVENGKKYAITGIVRGQDFGVIKFDECKVG